MERTIYFRPFYEAITGLEAQENTGFPGSMYFNDWLNEWPIQCIYLICYRFMHLHIVVQRGR